MYKKFPRSISQPHHEKSAALMRIYEPFLLICPLLPLLLARHKSSDAKHDFVILWWEMYMLYVSVATQW